MHVYPFSNPLTPALKHGQLRNKLRKVTHAANLLNFCWSSCPRFHSIRPDKHIASCQHKISTPAKQKRTRETWGLGTGRGNPERGSAMHRALQNQLLHQQNQAKTKPNPPPPKNHPNKTLSTIKIIKNIIFLT